MQLPRHVAQRAARLIARKHHMRVIAPEVVAQVMADTPAVAHAAARDDDATAAACIERLRILHAVDQSKVGQLKWVAVAAPALLAVAIEKSSMAAVDVRDAQGHG